MAHGELSALDRKKAAHDRIKMYWAAMSANPATIDKLNRSPLIYPALGVIEGFASDSWDVVRRAYDCEVVEHYAAIAGRLFSFLHLQEIC